MIRINVLSESVLLTWVLLFAACSQRRSQPFEPAIENLYGYIDTVCRHGDTMILESRTFDTIIVETGIFSYLQYDYANFLPDRLIGIARTAVAIDRVAGPKAAGRAYRKVIDFDKSYTEHFSDGGLHKNYIVGEAILRSYAHERLGSPDSAIYALRPHQAYIEAYHTRITDRYISLCIKRYGREQTQAELRRGLQHIHRIDMDPKYEPWAISVFGAQLPIRGAEVSLSPSVQRADSTLRTESWYALLFD